MKLLSCSSLVIQVRIVSELLMKLSILSKEVKIDKKAVLG